MPDRTPYIAANWKMHKTVAEAAEFVDALLPRIAATQSDVVICAPFTALTAVVERRYGTAVKVAAQNMHEEDWGAFTGEVSPAMLAKLNVTYVIAGHSERRELFGETDEWVNKKVKAILAHGMTPILCVGETLEEREAEATEAKVDGQVRAGLAKVTKEQVGGMVVAYEADHIDGESHLGWSVIITGRACRLSDEIEIERYRDLLQPWVAGGMDDV